MTASNRNGQGWRVVIAALQVRLRFLFAVSLLAVIAFLWPWWIHAWERLNARWSPFNLDSSVTSDREYFCPMDPGVVSGWPAICPICNMDLISRRKGESTILPSGVVARMQLSPYRVSLAGVRTVEVKARNGNENRTDGDGESELLVPITAVVHWGADTIVYVESMPGMFDGHSIKLGDREGDSYVVLDGLKEGQRVVVMGTLLVDAENRLHPHLSTQYFGATTQVTSAPLSRQPKTIDQHSGKSLDESQNKLVDLQRYCPVTQAPLGSMGTPVFVEIENRQIALCCIGCQDRLLANPTKYLAWLDAKLASEKESK